MQSCINMNSSITRRSLTLQINLTATAPACRRSSTPFQTQTIASQFSSVLVDVTLISSSLSPTWAPRPAHHENSKTRPNRGEWFSRTVADGAINENPANATYRRRAALICEADVKLQTVIPSVARYALRPTLMSRGEIRASIYSTGRREAWAAAATARQDACLSPGTRRAPDVSPSVEGCG